MLKLIFLYLKPTDHYEQLFLYCLRKTLHTCMVSLVTLATVTVLSRTWSLDKNTIVVADIKYISASCVYSESVAQ